MEKKRVDSGVEFTPEVEAKLQNHHGHGLPGGSRVNTAASSLASLDTNEDSVEDSRGTVYFGNVTPKHGKKKKRKKKKVLGELDLFERVMENGKGLVYDPGVGQFRERKGLGRRKSISPADMANLHGVNDHFHYVKFMKREKVSSLTRRKAPSCEGERPRDFVI